MLLSFGGNIGEIESEKKEKRKKKIGIFHILFFFCERAMDVSGSALPIFKSLSYKSGGATAFGNIVRFLGGPARMDMAPNANLHTLSYFK